MYDESRPERGVTLLTRRPRSNPVVCGDEILADKYRVVPVCDAPYQLSIDLRSAISALVMCAEGIREAARRHGQERRRKRFRSPLRKECISGFEVEGRLRLLGSPAERGGLRESTRPRLLYALLGQAQLPASNCPREVSGGDGDSLQGRDEARV